MRIKINDNDAYIEHDHTTVAELLKARNIPTAGTAVAINAQIVCGNCWETRELQEGDNVMIISAAYGG